MKHTVSLLFLAGILVNITKRISTPHWNLCCRPAPTFSQKKKKGGKKKGRRGHETRENKHNKRKSLSKCSCAPAELKLLVEVLTRKIHSPYTTNLRSSLGRKKKKKKLLLQSGLNFGQDIKLYDSWDVCSRRRGFALIGTRVFKGTVSAAQGPEDDTGASTHNICMYFFSKFT